MPDEKITSTTTFTDKSATATIYDNVKIRVRFNGDLLRQNQVTYNHGSVVNIYIVYETTPDTKTVTYNHGSVVNIYIVYETTPNTKTVTYNHGSVVNIYIVYETTPDTKTSNIALDSFLVELN